MYGTEFVIFHVAGWPVVFLLVILLAAALTGWKLAARDRDHFKERCKWLAERRMAAELAAVKKVSER